MSKETKRYFFIFLGFAVLLLFYFMPQVAPAIDPMGKSFELTQSGKAGIGLFLLAGIFWVFEVIPIGVTSIAIGVLQPVFGIREAKDAFRDFMDPTVMFILGSLLVGIAFTQCGITKRVAYKMLVLVGEDTRKILLGVFVLTALLTHVMAHTAVAGAMFPIMMSILALYGGDPTKPSKFGKALFMGMAFSAGAGSICTMMGGARNPAAVGFFKEFTGQDIGFLEFSAALAPFGWITVFLVFFLMITIYKPEKLKVQGLRQRAQVELDKLGPITKQEIFVLAVVGIALCTLIFKQYIPALKSMDRSIPLLAAGLVFFITNILTVKELEKSIPWNIVLLFSGAMSIGFALWQTGAAEWMAVSWLSFIKDAPWLVFLLGISFLVLILTNFIMNVAAISICLPVALVIAKYLGVNPEVVLYASVAMSGMPFLLLIGAAPNAIAYESKQFTTGEFFVTGIPASLAILAMVAILSLTFWPLIGIPAVLS
ncbi:anion transporter [Desulforamulus reducens MI-1]|uniref:Anion transporter n=1 Tax=Desulforamulus reducens (strain ATCC BAA-1160 / DSM 100696 / MI-1) TaxID=349161 RepID=A4J603_DESRM|nr:SLC13 family permease [Desulforamulus reducens]ABO50506.1 anion transporter [Desulforamulus reducens MI-1]